MKKCKWSVLKRENDGKQLNLEVEDQLYIDKVVRYLNSHKNGMMETEIIRKDLIGIAEEAQKNGERLENSLGDVKEFTENLVTEGRKESKKDQIYYCIQEIGKSYLVVIALVFFLAITIGFQIIFWELAYSVWQIFYGFSSCLVFYHYGRCTLLGALYWLKKLAGF